jgi:hypothetical protein
MNFANSPRRVLFGRRAERSLFETRRYTAIFVSVMVSLVAMGQDDQAELLEHLLTQNEAARQSIHSASYELQHIRTFPMESRMKVAKVTAKTVFSGKNRWDVSSLERTDILSNELEFAHTTSAVLNDEYLALKLPNLPPYVFLHDSIDSLNPHNKWPEAKNPYDIYPYLFGPSTDQSLREAVSLDGFERVIEKVYDEELATEVYRIGVYEDGSEHARADYFLDPGKGYSLVKTVYYNTGGHVWVKRVTTVGTYEDSNGQSVDFPLTFEENYYGDRSDISSQDEPKRSNVVSVVSESVSLNMEVPQEQFTIPALHYTGASLEMPLIVWDMKGSVQNGLIIDDELVLYGKEDEE